MQPDPTIHLQHHRPPRPPLPHIRHRRPRQRPRPPSGGQERAGEEQVRFEGVRNQRAGVQPGAGRPHIRRHPALPRRREDQGEQVGWGFDVVFFILIHFYMNIRGSFVSYKQGCTVDIHLPAYVGHDFFL